MSKFLLPVVLALALQGCFLDDLCGTRGDDERPAYEERGKVNNPNSPVYHGDCKSEGKC